MKTALSHRNQDQRYDGNSNELNAYNNSPIDPAYMYTRYRFSTSFLCVGHCSPCFTSRGLKNCFHCCLTQRPYSSGVALVRIPHGTEGFCPCRDNGALHYEENLPSLCSPLQTSFNTIKIMHEQPSRGDGVIHHISRGPKSRCGVSKASFPRHPALHSAVKPHVCWVPGCERAFSRSNHLKAQYLTHGKLGGRNRYVATLDKMSPIYSPTFRGQLNADGWPLSHPAEV